MINLTLEQIQNTDINLKIVQEGVLQAEKRLGDALDTRKTLEQKTFPLLSGYITVATALLAGAAHVGTTNPLFIPLTFLGFLFVAGVTLLILSLSASNYGTIGRYPDTWLQPDTLNGDDNTFAILLAYILYDYQDRIEKSDESNNKKGTLLNYGIWCGALSPAFFLVYLAYTYIH